MNDSDKCHAIAANIATTHPGLWQPFLTTWDVGCCIDEVHRRACPLRLDLMLEHSVSGNMHSSVVHDVAGILIHFNMSTQKLEDMWTPRFANQ